LHALPLRLFALHRLRAHFARQVGREDRAHAAVGGPSEVGGFQAPQLRDEPQTQHEDLRALEAQVLQRQVQRHFAGELVEDVEGRLEGRRLRHEQVLEDALEVPPRVFSRRPVQLGHTAKLQKQLRGPQSLKERQEMQRLEVDDCSAVGQTVSRAAGGAVLT
jgi:hypothetical protein